MVGFSKLLTEVAHCNLPCSHGSSIGLFFESYFLVFIVCLMFILFCVFIWLDSVISMVSKIFDLIFFF